MSPSVGWGRQAPPSPCETTKSDSQLLEVEHLAAGYGDIRAVWDVSLTVGAGRITTLLGPNGAGKSTTVLAVAGMVNIFDGRITSRGRDLGRLLPHERITGFGIGLVQEGKRIFRRLTVEENLRIGWWPRRHEGKRALSAALQSAYEQFPMLGERRRARAGLLSGGQQQMLAIAQALIWRPQVVILDEPSAGLAPVVMGEVLQLVRRLRDQGFGVLLVEQLVDAALSVADDVVVINSGRVVASGTSESIGGREGVRKIYMGAGSR